jgi:hypothetical protein
MLATLITPEAKLNEGISLNKYVKPLPISCVDGIILRIKKTIAIIDCRKFIKKVPT